MRFRIDFTVREVGVPDDKARGITFGDEVEGHAVGEFFDRCRDAIQTLFNGGKRPVPDDSPKQKPSQVAAVASKRYSSPGDAEYSNPWNRFHPRDPHKKY